MAKLDITVRGLGGLTGTASGGDGSGSAAASSTSEQAEHRRRTLQFIAAEGKARRAEQTDLERRTLAFIKDESKQRKAQAAERRAEQDELERRTVQFIKQEAKLRKEAAASGASLAKEIAAGLKQGLSEQLRGQQAIETAHRRVATITGQTRRQANTERETEERAYWNGVERYHKRVLAARRAGEQEAIRERDRMEEEAAQREIARRKKIAQTVIRVGAGAAGIAGLGFSSVGNAVGSFGGSVGSTISGLSSGGIGGLLRAPGQIFGAAGNLAGSIGTSALTAGGRGLGAGLGGLIGGPVGAAGGGLLGGGLGTLAGGALSAGVGVVGGVAQLATSIGSQVVEGVISTVETGLKTGLGAAIEAAARAAKGQPIREAFKSLTEGVGEDAAESLKLFQKATDGTVDSITLLTNANLALVLGASETSEQFATLAGAAVKLGRAVGKDPVASIEDLTRGVGRMSSRILDNLGIFISAAVAQEKYALSLGKTRNQLDATEKKLAFQKEAYLLLTEAAEDLGDQSASFAVRMGAVQASLLDLQETAGGPLIDAFSDLLPTIKDITTQFSVWLSENRVEIATKLRKAIGRITDFVKEQAALLKEKGLAGYFDDAQKAALKLFDTLLEKGTRAFAALATSVELTFNEMRFNIAEAIQETADKINPLKILFVDNDYLNFQKKQRKENFKSVQAGVKPRNELAAEEFLASRGLGAGTPENRNLSEFGATGSNVFPAAQAANAPAGTPSDPVYTKSQSLGTATSTSGPVTAPTPQNAAISQSLLGLSPTVTAPAPLGSGYTLPETLVGRPQTRKEKAAEREAINLESLKRIFLQSLQELSTAGPVDQPGIKKLVNPAQAKAIGAALDVDKLDKRAVNALIEHIEALEEVAKKERILANVIGEGASSGENLLAKREQLENRVQTLQTSAAKNQELASQASNKLAQALERGSELQNRYNAAFDAIIERSREQFAQVAKQIRESFEQQFRGQLSGAREDSDLPLNVRRGFAKADKKRRRARKESYRRQFGSYSSNEIANDPALEAEIESGIVGTQLRVQRPLEQERDRVAKRDFGAAYAPEIATETGKAVAESNAALQKELDALRKTTDETGLTMEKQIAAQAEVAEVQKKLAESFQKNAEEQKDLAIQLKEQLEKLKTEIDGVTKVVAGLVH